MDLLSPVADENGRAYIDVVSSAGERHIKVEAETRTGFGSAEIRLEIEAGDDVEGNCRHERRTVAPDESADGMLAPNDYAEKLAIKRAGTLSWELPGRVLQGDLPKGESEFEFWWEWPSHEAEVDLQYGLSETVGRDCESELHLPMVLRLRTQRNAKVDLSLPVTVTIDPRQRFIRVWSMAFLDVLEGAGISSEPKPGLVAPGARFEVSLTIEPGASKGAIYATAAIPGDGRSKGRSISQKLAAWETGDQRELTPAWAYGSNPLD